MKTATFRRPIYPQSFWQAGLLVAIFFTMDFALWLLLRSVPAKHPALKEIHQTVLQISTLILTASVVLFGMFRAFRPHPLVHLHRGFPEWLMTTPWEPTMPLLNGPPNLVWEDLALAATVIGIAWFHGISWVMVTCAYLSVYSVLSTLWSWEATPKPLRYVFCLLPATVLINQSFASPVTLAADIVGCGIAYISLRRLVRRLPFQRREDQYAAEESKKRRKIMWPMAPTEYSPRIGWFRGFATAATIGVYGYAFGKLSVKPLDEIGAIALSVIVAIFIALVRMMSYRALYPPPISDWGRIRTGRLIIPGYDKIWLSPLAIVGAAIVVVPAEFMHVDPWLFVAVSITLSLGLAMTLPPTKRSWDLTGHHRRPLSARGPDPHRLQASGKSSARHVTA